MSRRTPSSPLGSQAERIAACRRCPRLVEHCREIARVKRRAYRDEDYWGKPVPSLGPASARVLLVGLAPGAHGANRTGRVFTGDSSGDWLYRALHEAGFANRPESVRAGDGTKTVDARISCAVRCAPPGNRPNTAERDACRPFLLEELDGLRRLRVVLALGRFAFEATVRSWSETRRAPWATAPVFGHGTETRTTDSRIHLIASYHPSRQNTQTGRLTQEMFRAPFTRIRDILDSHE